MPPSHRMNSVLMAVTLVAAAVLLVRMPGEELGQRERLLFGCLEWEAEASPWAPEVLTWAQRVILRNVSNAPFEGTVTWTSRSDDGRQEDGEETISLPPGVSMEIHALLPPPDRALGDCKMTMQVAVADGSAETLAWTVSRAVPGGARRGMKLDGVWEVRREDHEAPQYPSEGEWREARVPVNWCSPPLQTGWYRRQVTPPEVLRGERTVLQFDGLGQRVGVYWNGELVGENFGGYVPWEVDVTGHVRWDESNEIVLSVERDRELEKLYGGSRGSNSAAFWNEVRLLSRPAVYVENVFIVPSVQDRTLTVRTTVRNEGPNAADVQVRAAVLDGGVGVLRLEPAAVQVPGGGEVVAQQIASWPDPRLWWPHDPHLYALRTDLSTGDRVHTRFGFREFAIRGTDFTLNGIRCFFRRGSMCPRDWAGGVAQARRHMEGLRNQELNSFRTHYAFAPSFVLEVADELGLLVVSEGAAFGSHEEELWWENFADQWRQTIRRGWNHPSLVIYSTVNEFKGEAGQQERLHQVNEMMQSLDPSRVVSQDSSSRAQPDSAGARNRALNWHYPWRTIQAYPDWLFETLDRPQVRSWEGMWDRDRPMVVGEFLCSPCTGMDPMSSLMGEDLYVEEDAYWRARGRVARLHCDTYRLMGLAGANPWSRMTGRTLPPVALLWREWSGNLFAGDTFERTVTVDNTTFQGVDTRLTWQLIPQDAPEGPPAMGGSIGVAVGPGEMRDVPLRFRVPTPESATAYELRLVLAAHEGVLDRKSGSVVVFPRHRLTASADTRIAIHDPEGGTVDHLQKAGLHLPRIDVVTPDALGGLQMLLIGEELPAEAAETLTAPLQDFTARGGRVVLLAQDSAQLVSSIVPGLCILEGHENTRAFPRTAGHPLLRGIPGPALSHWKPDGYITRRQFRKPTTGTYRIVAESGGRGGTDWVAGWPSGLEWTPLMVLRHGRGEFVLCQYELAGRLLLEPAARRLLQNLLDYVAEPLPAPATCGTLVAGDDELREAVGRLGLEARALEDTDVMNPGEWPLILASGGHDLPRHAARLREYVEAGGRLFVQGLTPEGLPGLETILGRSAVSLREGTWTSALREGDGPLTAGLSHRDLWWAVQPRGALCDRGPDRNDRTGRYADPVAPLASYELHVEPPLQAHTRPAFLASAVVGRGQVVVCQMRWDRALDRPPQDSEQAPGLILPIVDEPADMPAMTAPFPRRVAMTLLANSGATFRLK